MSKEEYLNKRKELLDKGQGLIDKGDLENFKSLSDEVKALDERYANESKARADMEALKNDAPAPVLENKSVNVNGVPIDSTGVDNTNSKNDDLYVNAWANHMMEKPMTNEEKCSFEMMNAAMTTESHAILIPKTVVAGIWKEVGEQYPLYEDVLKTNVKGNLTVLKSDSSSNAKWYDEETKTEDGDEKFSEATLHGCELSRSVTISWKLRSMAIDEFIPFITSQLAEEMGKAAAYGTFSGKGVATSGSSEKDEPTGIKTALVADKSKGQIVTVKGEPTYKDLTKMISLVKGAYKKGSKFYATGTFIWNVLANVLDKTGKPYFIPDTTAGGVGRLFGYVVEEDDSVDTLLFGNANKGYHLNVNKAMTLDAEDHKKNRNTDYIAYAIMDGNVRTLKAFSYLVVTASDVTASA